MPVPNSQEIQRPLLEIFKDEAPHNFVINELAEHISDQLKIELDEMSTADKTVFKKNINEAIDYLLKNKFLSHPLKSTYLITRAGSEFLNAPEKIITEPEPENINEIIIEENQETETQEILDSEPENISAESPDEQEIQEPKIEEVDEAEIEAEAPQPDSEQESESELDDSSINATAAENEIQENESIFEDEKTEIQEQEGTQESEIEENNESDSSDGIFLEDENEIELENKNENENENENINENFEDNNKAANEEIINEENQELNDFKEEAQEEVPEENTEELEKLENENSNNSEDINMNEELENFNEVDTAEEFATPEIEAPEEEGEQDFSDEGIGELVAKYNAQLAAQVLDKIESLHQDNFCMLVMDLLSKMGYQVFRSALYTNEATGSDLIQGIILEDKPGMTPIYIQARKLSRSRTVSQSDMSDFIRVIEGKGGKGMFVTAGKFATAAQDAAEEAGIMLVDGGNLAGLMIKNNFCFNTKKIFELKSFDTEIFGDYEG